MSNNAKGTDVEEGGNQEQRRRIPPARRAKQQATRQGAGGEPRASTLNQIMAEMVEKRGVSSGTFTDTEALTTPRPNLQKAPESVLISDQMQPFFTGITFKLAGFPELRQEELSDWIVDAEGELVFGDLRGTVDYMVVPTGGLHNPLTNHVEPHKHLVSDLWIEDCADSGQLLPIEYRHRPVGQILEQPLKGVVACISGYEGLEREFLLKLVVALGGVSQEVFARRDHLAKNMLRSTHLICPEPEGVKYNAAKTWKVTVVTKDWLRTCLREKVRVSEKEFLVGEAETSGNQAPDEVSNREEVAEVTPMIPGRRGNEEEVAKIADLASKKMKLEVDAKVKEMESLKLQREAAVARARLISSGIERKQKSLDGEREILRRLEVGGEFDKKRIERLNTEQQRIQEVKEEIMKGQAERQRVIQQYQASLKRREGRMRHLKEKLEETSNNVRKLEKNLEDLPSAPGFSQDYVSLLDNQIATRRKELECPVCFDEVAPPIYTCVAQHLVCAKCR